MQSSQKQRMAQCSQQSSKMENEDQVYERVRLLGTGSFGKAYLVKERRNGKQWVIKQINIADMSSSEQENVQKQAKILQLLDHPNIIKFKQVYRTPKMKLNIVTEYADGLDLAQRIRLAKKESRHFEESDILRWFIQMCLGVKHIHDRKIIHRDLKGQNIFLTADNCVKIGDFGVARLMENTLSKARTVVGSPYYLSPEIIENKPYSSKTDIWSLGALLFQMCALVPPFTANNLQFLALKIVKGAVPQISDKYSPELRSLVRSMLHTKESLRPNINEILCSWLISTNIKHILQNTQKREQPAEKLDTNSCKEFYTLRAPPKLKPEIDEQIDHRSEVFIKETESILVSPQLPQKKCKQAGKTGPNNFFNRPSSNRKKFAQASNLADLIQITPSHLEKHSKPIIPKPRPSEKLNEIKPIVSAQSPLSSAFAKKRLSSQQFKPNCPQLSKDKQKHKQIKSKKEINLTEQKTKPSSNNAPIPIRDNRNRKNNKNKGAIVRKGTSTKKKCSEKAEIPLQICSQQAKKAQQAERKPQKQIKKKSKLPPKPVQAYVTGSIEQQLPVQEPKEQATVDIEDQCDSYYDQFESYDTESGALSQGSVPLSLSASESKDRKYVEMLKEMEHIKNILEEANGHVAQLPMFGSSIPQLIQFSVGVREDCEENEANVAKSPVSRDVQRINLQCFTSYAELENLRMSLEEDFGLDKILFIHHAVEAKIAQAGLELDQDETIKEILAKKPQIDEALLRKNFTMILTVVSLENQFNS